MHAFRLWYIIHIMYAATTNRQFKLLLDLLILLNMYCSYEVWLSYFIIKHIWNILGHWSFIYHISQVTSQYVKLFDIFGALQKKEEKKTRYYYIEPDLIEYVVEWQRYIKAINYLLTIYSSVESFIFMGKQPKNDIFWNPVSLFYLMNTSNLYAFTRLIMSPQYCF